jgi:hypothetical protein
MARGERTGQAHPALQSVPGAIQSALLNSCAAVTPPPNFVRMEHPDSEGEGDIETKQNNCQLMPSRRNHDKQYNKGPCEKFPAVGTGPKKVGIVQLSAFPFVGPHRAPACMGMSPPKTKMPESIRFRHFWRRGRDSNLLVMVFFDRVRIPKNHDSRTGI